MARTISEVRRFTRAQLEAAAKSLAKLEIVGGMYCGDFGEQTVVWEEDGSLVVTTVHTPAEVGDWQKHK